MKKYDINTSGDIINKDIELILVNNVNQLSNYNNVSDCVVFSVQENKIYIRNNNNWELISSSATGSYNSSAVGNLNIQAGDTRVLLSWNSLQNSDVYKIYQTSGGFERLSLVTSSTSAIVDGLQNNTLYAFRVVGVGQYGDSSSSVKLSATPIYSPPIQVTGLTIDSIDQTSILASWDNIISATGYNVYLTPVNNLEYYVTSSTSNSKIIENLIESTSYDIRVAAYTLSGEGLKSEYVNFETLPQSAYPVGQIYVTSGSNKISLNWYESQYATSYSVFRSTTSGSGYSLLSAVSNHYYDDYTSNINTLYYYYVVASNLFGSASPSPIVSGTRGVSTFVEYTDNAIYTSFSGMMLNTEPDEGIVPPQGRTYSMSISPPRILTGSSYYDYIDVTFANMESSAVSGLKIISRPNYSSTLAGAITSASITQDITTGWVSGTVNITSGTSATPSFSTIRLPLHSSYKGTEELIIKTFVPPLSSAKYARMYTTCGDFFTQNQTPFVTQSRLNFEYRNGFVDSSNNIRIAYTNNDSIINQQTQTSAWVYSDSGTLYDYAAPKPSSLPWMMIKWHQAETSARKIYELIGDSSVQGYGDLDGTFGLVNVGGITRRHNLTKVSETSDSWIINFGCGNVTPEQYLNKWEGYAKSTSGTALIYSIFSVNTYVLGENNFAYPTRIEEMKTNCLLAEQKAKQYGRVFIPMFYTNTVLYQLNVLPASAATTNYTWQAKELYDWAKARYGNRLLDLQPAVLDTTNEIGINMASNYTNDNLYLNNNGYNAMGSRLNSIIEQVYLKCKEI